MGHHGGGFSGELSVGFDPIAEGVARPPHVRHPDADPDLVIKPNLPPEAHLDRGDDERDLGSTPKPFAPKLRPRGFEVGHDGGVVDVSQGIHIAPPHLDRTVEWITFHNLQISSSGVVCYHPGRERETRWTGGGDSLVDLGE